MSQVNSVWKPSHDASVVGSSISSLSSRSYLHPKYTTTASGNIVSRHSLNSGLSNNTCTRRVVITTGLKRRQQYAEKRNDSNSSSFKSFLSKNMINWKKNNRRDAQKNNTDNNTITATPANGGSESTERDSSDKSVVSAFSKMSVSSKLSGSSNSSKISKLSVTSKSSLRSKINELGSRFKNTKKSKKSSKTNTDTSTPDDKSVRSVGSVESVESKESTNNNIHPESKESKQMIKNKTNSRNKLGITRKLSATKGLSNKPYNVRVKLNSFSKMKNAKRKKVLVGGERHRISTFLKTKKNETSSISSHVSLPYISEEGESQCSDTGKVRDKVERREIPNDQKRDLSSLRDNPNPTEIITMSVDTEEVEVTTEPINQEEKGVVEDESKLNLKEPIDNSITPRFKNTTANTDFSNNNNQDEEVLMATKPIEFDTNNECDMAQPQKSSLKDQNGDIKHSRIPMKKSRTNKIISHPERPRPPFTYIIVDNNKRERKRSRKKHDKKKKEEIQNHENTSQEHTWTDRAFSCMFPQMDEAGDNSFLLPNDSNLSFVTDEEETIFF